MKKTFSLLLAMIMVLLAFGAVPALAEKTVVTYWSNDRHDEVYMTEMINKFNAAHDDIEIQMTIMTDDYENSILLAYQGGTAPDLVNGQSLDIKNFSDIGAIVNLRSFIEADAESAIRSGIKEQTDTPIQEQLYIDSLNDVEKSLTTHEKQQLKKQIAKEEMKKKDDWIR